jgi:hypothetical protein
MREEAGHVLHILSQCTRSSQHSGMSGMPADDVGGIRAEYPPAWALPVSVPSNITLARRDDLFIRISTICAYPVGFLFYLVVGFDRRRLSYGDLDFHGNERLIKPSPARVEVRFSDGQATDSATRDDRRAAREPVLIPDGASPGPGIADDVTYGWQESRWWVSPLPPTGPVGFAVYRLGFTQPVGVGRIDAGSVLDAAALSQTRWSSGEHALWNRLPAPSRRPATSRSPCQAT